MLSIDLIANPAPWRILELVSETFAAVARKVELAARRLSPGLKTALQAFFNQRTECCAFALGYTPRLLNQRVRKLYRGFHKGRPYSPYGYTVLFLLLMRKVRH